MILLAIDCAASLCAACVYEMDTATERGRAVLDLGKGHAEHLMAVIAQALERAGVGYADLGAVAVSVGPGSFTGLRVGVSTARGLALALAIPATGVTTLEALAAETRDKLGTFPVLAALDAGRGEIHAGLYDELGAVRYAPAVMTLDEAAALAASLERPLLAGTAAQAIGDRLGERLVGLGPLNATADIAVYARVAAAKGAGTEKPKPLYLRAPDAKPQASFVLPRAQE